MSEHLTFSEIVRLRQMVADRHRLEGLANAVPSVAIDFVELVLRAGILADEVTPRIQRAAAWALRRELNSPAPPGSVEGCTDEVAFRLYEGARGSSSDQVYFVQACDGGPIKIGHSRAVASRLVSLQSSSPARLRLLVQLPGGEQLERFFHEAFAEFRLHGEWFSPDPCVTRVIADAVRMKEADS